MNHDEEQTAYNQSTKKMKQTIKQLRKNEDLTFCGKYKDDFKRAFGKLYFEQHGKEEEGHGGDHIHVIKIDD